MKEVKVIRPVTIISSPSFKDVKLKGSIHMEYRTVKEGRPMERVVTGYTEPFSIKLGDIATLRS